MKVTIIGRGIGWREAPKDGNTLGITHLNLNHPVKRVIDMNDYTLWGDCEARLAVKSRAKATREGVPYIDRDNYPLNQIIDFFGIDYFSNTVDYAIALSIYEKYDEIDIHGVTMEQGGEYAYQKPGVEFWIGQALGRGIKTKIFGDRSSILKTQDGLLYGYGIPQRKELIYANL